MLTVKESLAGSRLTEVAGAGALEMSTDALEAFVEAAIAVDGAATTQHRLTPMSTVANERPGRLTIANPLRTSSESGRAPRWKNPDTMKVDRWTRNAMSFLSTSERLAAERGQRAPEHGIEVLSNPPWVLDFSARTGQAADMAEPGQDHGEPNP